MEKVLRVVVDYNKSLADMIKAGNYGWFKKDINHKHFPLQGIGQHEAELILVHLNRGATTLDVLMHMYTLDLEPAKIEHLLAFGETYPEIQKEFMVVALGSSFFKVSCFFCPGLSFGDNQRKLVLNREENGYRWFSDFRFLALCK